MAKKWTLAEALASYGGAAGKNPRWSWSARTPDGKAVVMTFWQDRFDYKTKPPTYRAKSGAGANAWLDKPGNRERLENLIWAVDNCGGRVHVVITVAENVNVQPRKIADCFPQPRMQMQVKELDRQTGEFFAELVDETTG